MLPQVRKGWIDTGKIRFVFRDFPLDRAALMAAQLAHCGDRQHYWDLLQAELAKRLPEAGAAP